MKRVKYLIFLILLSIMFVNMTYASSYLTYDKDYTCGDKTINDLISYDNGYIILTGDEDNTYLTTNDMNNNTIATKQFSDLINSQIIKFNDEFLLAGISENVISLYKINSNLQISTSKETDIFETDYEINLYSYEDKIYLALLEDNQLLNNNLYEIDNSLNVIEKRLSSFDSNQLKNILHSDYFLIHNNGTQTDNKISYYLDSTYTEQYNILVGLEEDELFNTNALLQVYDNNGNEIWKITSDDYTMFIDTIVVNNKIVVIAENNSSSTLLIYDFEKNILEELDINKENFDIALVEKINNKIALVYNNFMIENNNAVAASMISFYDYTSYIYINETIYGSIDIAKTAIPSTLVPLNITPNSGYEIKDIIIKDEQGNIIPVNNLQFKMPASDVYITINLEPIVINPDTGDIAIILLIFSSFIILFILIKFYIKYSWLR